MLLVVFSIANSFFLGGRGRWEREREGVEGMELLSRTGSTLVGKNERFHSFIEQAGRLKRK